MPYLSLTSQELLIGMALVVFLFSIIVLLAQYRSAKPYERNPSILTPSEQRFYKALSSVVKERAIIMAKVRVADLLKVKRSINRKYFWSHFSKISQKHIDFVLIYPMTYQTLCVIELDDKSHLNFDRMKRDQFINQIMAQTGIPLCRFRVQRRYDRGEILAKLDSYLKM